MLYGLRKSWGMVLCGAVLSAMVAWSAPAQSQAINLKLANTQPPNAPLGQAISRWAAEVEKRTNNAVKVQIFWSSQLGSSTDQIEQTMLGSIDIDIDDIVFYGRYSPRAKVVDVPYLFRDAQHLQKFMKSDLFNPVRKAVEDRGGFILNTEYNWFRGPYRTLLSSRPVLKPDDLAGLKLRMYESEIARKAWEYLGAKTVVITWAEVYLALKQGVVDAVTSPVELIWPMKFTEAVENVTRTNEFPQNIVTLINKKRFDSLPPNVQKTMIEVTNEVGGWYTDLVNKSAAADLEKIKTEHHAKYFEPDLKPWRSKAKGFLKQAENQGLIEQGIVDKINGM